jgi:hypothetical protein
MIAKLINLLKKHPAMGVTLLLVFSAVTFNCKNAKADNCPCWYAEYDPNTNICTYHFCLVPPGDKPTENDYQFRYLDPYTLIIHWIELAPVEEVSPCGEDDHENQCAQYKGIFWCQGDPRSVLTWCVFDHNLELVEPIPACDM